ncbi:hypothetical protein HOLleu_03380 [Holothuria leucospilota]|uniref:Uncharacterized protein n=1 Tax=Holothuria leucospilota TaxID=206669 RepID=A0A9Q1HLV6_HOLLE|nr:hypothetical protein HOLleu_03380 [Holothuria leucospilota]
MPGCTFQESWTTDDAFKVWVARGSTANQARCKLRDVNIDLTSMGRTALKSHEECFYFQANTPDSEIAKSMTFGETKSMYMACFGLAPYFSKLLEKKAKEQPFVLLFDESLNRELQKKQLDIHFCVWDDNKVSTRYYTSDFLGHACTVDIIDSFDKNVAKTLTYKNLQVSMDGPNVNWSVFKKLSEKLAAEYDTSVVDIGSCGLHTMHNSVRAAFKETGWDLCQILSALHTLFDDVPARRADYEACTGQSYGINFCIHRCEGAIDVFPHVKKYVDKAERKEVKAPGTKSYEIVKKWSKDPLARAKMMFIIFAAKIYIRCCEQQCNALSKHKWLKKLCVEKLMKIDISSQANLKAVDQIDIGFSTGRELKEVQKKYKLSERAILQFKVECKSVFTTLTTKMKLKSPLNYKVVKRVKSLDPEEINTSATDSLLKDFKLLLEELVAQKKILAEYCDDTLEQFRDVVQELRSNTDMTFQKDADKASEEAERKKNWFYVTKANALRKKAKDLEEQLPTLEKELEEQKTLLANL